MILIASSSPIKNDSPRGVDGHADTNQTKLNGRSNHTYEVRLPNASYVANSNRYGEILENVSPKSRDVIGRFSRGRGTCIVWFSVEPTTLDHSNIFFEKASNLISFERSYALRYLPSRMPHFEKIFELKLSHKWKVRYHVRVLFLL